MNNSEDIMKIEKKISFFYNIIQQTLMNTKKNKTHNIINEIEYQTCIQMLEQLNNKLLQLTENLNNDFNKESFISQLQVINNDISCILKLYGTDSFENLLIVCFGNNNKYITSDDNILKYEILKKYFHPTGYKVLNNDNNDYKNFDCSDIVLTTTQFYNKIYGMKVYIHNNIINKFIVVYGIVDDIIIHLLNDKYIQDKLKYIKNNIPKDSVFQTTIFQNYISSLNLKELIIYTSSEIYNKFVGYTYLYKLMKSKPLNNLIKDFLLTDLYSKRNTLMILLFNNEEYENMYICYILYDLLMNENNLIEEQQLLYESLPITIKQHFNIILKKVIQNTNDYNKDVTSVSLEHRIQLLKTSPIVKEKAFVKLKEIKNKSDENCSKARNYLDGLLKIPFGTYRKEPFLDIMNNNKILFQELINSNNLDYDIPKNNKYTSLEIFIHMKKINNKIISKKLISENDIKIMKKLYSQGEKSILLENIQKINNLQLTQISLNETKKYSKQELKKLILDFIEDNISNINLLNQLYNLYPNKSNVLFNNLYKLNQNFTYIKNYISNIKNVLDDSVYGHNNAKQQIEKIIGQWANGEQSGYCFGFEGSPGVGKTSLAKKGISNCLKDENGLSRPFAFIKMGGDTNGSTLHGHNYTYVGATWGSIVQILMDTQVMNPIIFIDEVDKISKTEHGKELIGILTHLLDFTQNDCFQDKYFTGIDLDLSKALFILSYNDPTMIDKVLLDRIHRIKFNHLSLDDKIIITNKHLLPEILNKMGLENMIIIKEDAITFLIEHYTIESGVRKLKELLFEIIGEININIFKNNLIVEEYPIILDINDIQKYLKDKPQINIPNIFEENKIGIVNGMWANSLGQGGILPLFAQYYPSNNFMDLKLTGSLEKVMSESVHVAQTLAWDLTPNDRKESISQLNNKRGIHIHAADGSITKDGPSGGVAITTLIFSLLNDLKIKQNFGITGEIDLNGNVCEIGGLDLKILGSVKSGCTSFLFPSKNKKDYEKLIEKYKNTDMFKETTFYPVDRIEQVFQLIFDR
jgi:ATP-dependent Lon protease